MITVNKYNVIDQDDSTDLKVKDDGKKYGFEIGKIFVKLQKFGGKVDCESKKSEPNGERGKRAKAVYYRNRVISGLHSRSRTLSRC